MGYTTEEVRLKLLSEGLSYEIKSIEKKGRGRPRKIERQEKEKEETIEVIEITKNGNKYLKTKENVLLDPKTFEIVGMDIIK